MRSRKPNYETSQAKSSRSTDPTRTIAPATNAQPQATNYPSGVNAGTTHPATNVTNQLPAIAAPTANNIHAQPLSSFSRKPDGEASHLNGIGAKLYSGGGRHHSSFARKPVLRKLAPLRIGKIMVSRKRLISGVAAAAVVVPSMFAFASPANAATLKGTCRDAGGTADATVRVSVGKYTERTVVNGIRTKKVYSVVRNIRLNKIRTVSRSNKVTASGVTARLLKPTQEQPIVQTPNWEEAIIGKRFTPGTVLTVTSTWKINGSLVPNWCDAWIVV